ncbi:MAG TPA: peptidoglycan-binding protein [Myxococcales bacterium]|jgi:peptidoglycan hydrolase-like protein with peptidoglycan-binding domain
MLSIGSRGADVTRLQNALKTAGYDPGGTDGVFGPKTKAAVTSFQRASGLGVDGVVGPKTNSALAKYYKDGYDAGQVSGPAASGTNHEKLMGAWKTAERMGLTVTSYKGGRHAPNSYHYSGRAIDVAGSPAAMARFYRYMESSRPTEMFYDPIGGIKNGNDIGAIGGHRDHVHLAF